MKYSKYYKQMNSLDDELKRAANAWPYDQDVYNDVVDRLNALHSAYYHHRRRRPWFALGSCIGLLIILLIIVYVILSALYTKGTQ